MELKSIGHKQVELTAGGMKVMFSCGDPVACRDTNGQCYFLEHGGRNEGTITKHITTWLADVEVATPMPQDFFDGVKRLADMLFRESGLIRQEVHSLSSLLVCFEETT
tara:strand:- start:244 stop:567 length:324 start_codon:yes stop_codon:yes gene_type:complete